MILAIDIGNTNIVIGCFNGSKIEFTERLVTNHKSTELEYAILFKNVMEIYSISPKNIDGGIISSVVPSLTNVIKRAMEKLTKADVMLIGPGIKTGLNILTDNPAQLGSDLVVDAVAGINEYPLPLVIFDMGTATTISVIDADKNYLGTVIIPGLEISLNSLVGETSQLPKISLDPPKSVIGRNTVDSMKSGILYSNASSMDGMVERIEKELGMEVTVVATGGLASSVVPFCERDIILDNELLLKGLMIIYNKNINK
ncbi:MAG: type III pantothenate kinase [Oscillospiraceae bacterium]|nr:type III pantothenate kinase [Oscillospiraceae bacterium]